jgi:hypothetical protein
VVLRSWQNVDLDGLVDFLDDPRTIYDGGSSGQIALPWDLSAEKYLGFARTDFRQRSARGFVNALGNAKRALHCQVDSVLYSTGFWNRATERRWDFIAKTDLLTELKIATPNVLRRINRLRNQVEHHYSIPGDAKQLEDFIDIVELFIASTRGFTASRYEMADFTQPSSRRDLSVEISFNGEDLVARLYGPGGRRDISARSYRRFRKLQIAVHQVAWREKMFLAN